MSWRERFVFPLVRWLTRHTSSRRIQTALMWPITTRLLGPTYRTTVARRGYQIEVGLHDQLNRTVLFFGDAVTYLWEPQTTKLAQLLVQKSQNSIVAGSHIGYSNLELFQHVPEGGKIFTFEPVPYLYQQSQRNVQLNNLDDVVKLSPQALSSRTGTATIYVESIRSSLVPYSSAHRQQTQLIRTITVDDFCKQAGIDTLDFMLLDVEGYELKVLQGAKAMLERNHPALIVEFAPRILAAMGQTDRELTEYLEQLGYQLFAIEDNYDLQDFAAWERRPVLLFPWRNYTGHSSYVNVLATTNIAALGIAVNASADHIEIYEP